MAGEKFIKLLTSGLLGEQAATQDGGSGNENKIVALDSSGHLANSMLAASVKIFRLYGGLVGRAPSDNEVLFSILMNGDEVFASGLPSNLGYVDTAPTSSVTFVIDVNGTPVGSMNVAAGANTATWTLSSTYTASNGDILTLYAPTPADATLADVRYTFVGTRS